MTFNIIEVKDLEISLDEAIKKDMIIGVIGKDKEKTCIVRLDVDEYTLLPTPQRRSMYNLFCIEKGAKTFLIGNYWKPIKAFSIWQEAYEWMVE